MTPRAKCIPAKPDALMLPYQERWVRDNSRLKIIEKARQIGMSWGTSYRQVRQTALDKTRYDCWVSSRDDIQAMLFLQDCIKFAGLLNTACKDLGGNIFRDEKGKPYTSHDMSFANGRQIHSMSSNPDAQAGKRGTRVLDEFALHPDPRKLYAIAYPGITWGGQMEIISTHRGSANFFNQLIQDAKGRNKRGFSLHRVTLQDALDQGFLYKLQTKLSEGSAENPILDMAEAEYFDFIRSGCPDEETFQQEYMCEPQDDSSAFLSYELVDGCSYPAAEEWETPLASAAQLYVGVDIGRDHDLTVIWVCEKVGGVYFTRRVIELQNKRFAVQEAELYPLLALPNMQRCCIDATGIGRQLAERARERFGYKVEEVQFTAPLKEQLAYPLRAAMEERNVRLPRDNPAIMADLRAIKKETTAAGNIRFAADRGKNGHADRFWALALALHAGASPSAQLPTYHPPRRRFERAAARRNRSVT